MGTRLELHQKLKDILGSDHVYFQPDRNVNLIYPCIVYKRSNGNTDFADNSAYRVTKRYQVTTIAYDPDFDVVDKIAMSFPMCIYDRNYTSDNLNHDVFNLYY